jgi:hypothetical protein
MLRALASALSLLLAIGFLSPMKGAEQVISSLTAGELRKIMESEGYTTVVDESRDNKVVWKVEGFRGTIFLDDSSLQFFAVFKATEETSLGKVNQWNRSKRYSRSYLDKDGDPVLELDLDLDGGVTRARIVDFLQTCAASFAVWRTEVLR